MSLFFVLTVVLCLVILGAAIVAVYHKNLATTVLAAGLVSLIASILYLILAAPDVAMTEASIGSGLSTVMFFYVLKRVKGGENG
jgi:energy-converting hydrogenase B subunit D